jgi:hypothetical protein
MVEWGGHHGGWGGGALPPPPSYIAGPLTNIAERRGGNLPDVTVVFGKGMAEYARGHYGQRG